jgi:hypothetical protein
MADCCCCCCWHNGVAVTGLKLVLVLIIWCIGVVLPVNYKVVVGGGGAASAAAVSVGGGWAICLLVLYYCHMPFCSLLDTGHPYWMPQCFAAVITASQCKC